MNHQNINKLLSNVSLKKLSSNFERISHAYRNRVDMDLKTREDALAYLIYRAPATMGVLQEVIQHAPIVTTVCDVGAAMGVSALVFDPSVNITCVEQAKALVEVGKELTDGLNVVWKKGPMQTVPFTKHDLFLFSYSLNELPLQEALQALSRAYAVCQHVVIVEPGTPEGQERVLSYRDHLINEGASLVAPCPHQKKCPLAETKKWCHFSKRIERTKEHRLLKGGSLGYEDEKYSYVVFSKTTKNPETLCRVIGHPQKEKHQVSVDVCMLNGVHKVCAKKRDKELFHSIKKCRWGDSLDSGIIDTGGSTHGL